MARLDKMSIKGLFKAVLAGFLFGTLLSLLISSPGCTLTKDQRQANRMAKKIETWKVRYPEAWEKAGMDVIKIDTVIKEIQLEGIQKIDTIRLKEVVRQYIRDTVQVEKFITQLEKVSRDTVQVDSLGLHVTIVGSGIYYNILKDSTIIEAEKAVEKITIVKTEVVRKRFYQDWLFWLIVGIGVAAYILFAVLKLGLKIRIYNE